MIKLHLVQNRTISVFVSIKVRDKSFCFVFKQNESVQTYLKLHKQHKKSQSARPLVGDSTLNAQNFDQ